MLGKKRERLLQPALIERVGETLSDANPDRSVFTHQAVGP